MSYHILGHYSGICLARLYKMKSFKFHGRSDEELDYMNHFWGVKYAEFFKLSGGTLTIVIISHEETQANLILLLRTSIKPKWWKRWDCNIRAIIVQVRNKDVWIIVDFFISLVWCCVWTYIMIHIAVFIPLFWFWSENLVENNHFEMNIGKEHENG
jgi:hypothetical protein